MSSVPANSNISKEASETILILPEHGSSESAHKESIEEEDVESFTGEQDENRGISVCTRICSPSLEEGGDQILMASGWIGAWTAAV
jgi:hypothetical protein